MLTKVEVHTQHGTMLSLPLQDVSSGFQVRDIDGLDPVPALVVSSALALQDRVEFQASRRGPRNIILELGLDPDYAIASVRSLRDHLYAFLMPKSIVTLRFFSSDKPTVDILGRVETFQAPMFTKDPKATISVFCEDSSFFVPTQVLLEGDTTSGSTGVDYIYPGSIETGIIFKLFVDRTLDEFVIYHRPADNTLRSFTLIEDLLAGDVVEINTITGSKGVTITRSSVESSLLRSVSPQANWINFFPGANNIRVYAEGAAIPYEIRYNAKYGGL